MANKVVKFNELLGNFYPGTPLPKRPSVPYGGGKPVDFRVFQPFNTIQVYSYLS